MPETAHLETLEALSPSESKTLKHCESDLENFRTSYYRAGEALRTIRDQRLYRETHPSFEAYLAEKWNMSRPWAYQLIDAANVRRNLSAVTDTSSSNEFQLRVLTNLDPEDQVQVYTKAKATAPEGRVTATHLQEV